MGFIMEGLDAEAYDRYLRRPGMLRLSGSSLLPDAGQEDGRRSVVWSSSTRSWTRSCLVLVSVGWTGSPTGRRRPGRWLLVAGILVAGALSWGFNYVRQSRSAEVVGDVVLGLRRDAIRAVMARDMSFFDEFSSGKIVSRVTSDTADFSNTVTLTLSLVSQVLLVVIITGALLTRDAMLTLIVLGLAPVIVAIALAFRHYARRVTTAAQRARGELNGTVQETMRGIAVARASARRGRSTTSSRTSTAERTGSRCGRDTSSAGSSGPVHGGWAGDDGPRVVRRQPGPRGELSAGDWYLFLQAVALFWFPLTSIASFWSQFQQGLSAAERVFALVDATPRVVQTGRPAGAQLRGEIVVRPLSVRLRRGPADPDRLLAHDPGRRDDRAGRPHRGRKVDHRPAGGALLRVPGRRLLIDGHDIRSFDLASYRRQIGVVPQLPFLFSGTVADNIRYPRQTRATEEVERAARQIAGGDWVELLQDGLATEVGEDGRGLSMGQRQLVALARVVIQDPAIVVLDEATASVDPLTEAQIQEGLDIVLAERTSIVIAHRLSTIRGADRILVLDHGRVVEEGGHDQLMLRGGRYAELYNTYFRHQSPDYPPRRGASIAVSRRRRVASLEGATAATRPPALRRRSRGSSASGTLGPRCPCSGAAGIGLTIASLHLRRSPGRHPVVGIPTGCRQMGRGRLFTASLLRLRGRLRRVRTSTRRSEHPGVTCSASAARCRVSAQAEMVERHAANAAVARPR
jgi:ABC-type multidrug transport system fused ATPase/permease subunit